MFLFLLACATSPQRTPDSGLAADTGEAWDGVATLGAMLSGRFDSSAQAEEDPQYYAVSLVACPVQAPDLGDHVLYIEQALVSQPSQPYRQRLYVLSQDGDAFVSAVYTLEDDHELVGLCEETEPEVQADRATLKEGCEVRLSWDGEAFEGGTVGEDCASDLNGASYATSEVRASPDRIESWDRGWDADGDQVWGATAGAYRFDRKD